MPGIWMGFDQSRFRYSEEGVSGGSLSARYIFFVTVIDQDGRTETHEIIFYRINY